MPTGPATVLVVEDETMIKKGTVESVGEEGYLALSASDADEALLMLAAHPEIDVLFTDIRMPGSMDGLALANEVRSTYPKMQVVIASGNLRPATDRMPKGATFLPKPYSTLQIAAALHELIDQSRPLVVREPVDQTQPVRHS